MSDSPITQNFWKDGTAEGSEHLEGHRALTCWGWGFVSTPHASGHYTINFGVFL